MKNYEQGGDATDYGGSTKISSSSATRTTIKRTTTTGYDGDAQTHVEEYHSDSSMQPIDQHFQQVEKGKLVPKPFFRFLCVRFY